MPEEDARGKSFETASPPKQRLLLVLHQLPVATDAAGGLVPTLQGAASALSDEYDVVWIGFPNPNVDPSNLWGKVRVEVKIAPRLHKEFYRFTSTVLWPVFHQKERQDFEPESFEPYREFTEQLADAVAAEYRPGDLIWVQDYHLILLPTALRERKKTARARIAYFLHIPFPIFEFYRKLPWKRLLLRGVLGADLIGLQTYDYAENLSIAVTRVLGIDTKSNQITFESRRVTISISPIGLHMGRVQEAVASDLVKTKIAEWGKWLENRQVIVGVDRMDAIKGIPQKLQAFERMLQDNPDLVGKVVLVQVAMPSREDVTENVRLRREVEEMVGRINSKYSKLGQATVHYRFAHLDFPKIVALFSIADVCLVMSLKDGLNLVSQEFVACQLENKGVLVLSEFAGAARCLAAAIRVNPWDVDHVAKAIKRSLEMGAEERADRHRSMYNYVVSHDAEYWGRKFLDMLVGLPMDERLGAEMVSEMVGTFARSKERVIFTSADSMAYMDTRLALESIAGEGVPVVVFDSQSSKELLASCGEFPKVLPVYLIAEYGCFWKPPDGAWDWFVEPTVPLRWLEEAKSVMKWFVKATPGSEYDQTRTCVLRWSWQASDPSYGEMQARELYMQLSEMTTQELAFTVQLSSENKTIDVVPQGHAAHAILKILKILDRPIDWALFVDVPSPPGFASDPSKNVYNCHVGDEIAPFTIHLESHAALHSFLIGLRPS
ncbi:hypothetical protein DIPPA_08835 [Diplonema papillatum]|nr:hypothetical protein DIPPA_08835 [Diplonema papillatum]KAJ9463361.1 hypothetical protein DIPPA_08835 [Diplonema papillatum]